MGSCSRSSSPHCFLSSSQPARTSLTTNSFTVWIAKHWSSFSPPTSLLLFLQSISAHKTVSLSNYAKKMPMPDKKENGVGKGRKDCTWVASEREKIKKKKRLRKRSDIGFNCFWLLVILLFPYYIGLTWYACLKWSLFGCHPWPSESACVSPFFEPNLKFMESAISLPF